MGAPWVTMGVQMTSPWAPMAHELPMDAPKHSMGTQWAGHGRPWLVTAMHGPPWVLHGRPVGEPRAPMGRQWAPNSWSTMAPPNAVARAWEGIGDPWVPMVRPWGHGGAMGCPCMALTEPWAPMAGLLGAHGMLGGIHWELMGHGGPWGSYLDAHGSPWGNHEVPWGPMDETISTKPRSTAQRSLLVRILMCCLMGCEVFLESETPSLDPNQARGSAKSGPSQAVRPDLGLTWASLEPDGPLPEQVGGSSHPDQTKVGPKLGKR